jgi:sugar lactone lactonase YvrE/enterochelin esterase-like enzyme
MFRKTLFLALCLSSSLIAAEGPYPVDPASRRQEKVPVGKVSKFSFRDSKIYPGTVRDYSVYVPAQYDGSQPAALMVFQDGESYLNPNGASKATIVFDNLIHSKEMPVTIGVFINPGVVPATGNNAQPRFNRSFEYDDFSDKYARFLIEELLPEVQKQYKISARPDDRGICGASSGAIAAFTAAWHRPDAFRRVYSMIGTYVGLRGGDEISTLIRKTEPKPLRIFLQDGSNDNNIYCGDWWMANQMMERSLTFAGYEVNHVWGEGAHSHQHGGAIFPDAMRWLWKDAATPVQTHYDRCKGKAKDWLIAGEDWQLVSQGHVFTEGPVCGPEGDVYFTDIPRSQIIRIGADGKVAVFLQETQKTNGLSFGPDGRLYGCRAGSKEIVSWDLKSKAEQVHARGIEANDLTVAHDGTIYATEPAKKAVWVIAPGQEKRLASDAFHGVNGIILTPDQTRVEVADPSGRFVYSCQRAKDGMLQHIQPYHHLHLPPADLEIRSAADGMKVTRDGQLLVATAMGIQICDQPGRVNLILPPPLGARHPSNVCFAGEGLKDLIITCGDKVYRRKTNMTGALSWQPPVNPPKPGL